jgi:hypothetical protein
MCIFASDAKIPAHSETLKSEGITFMATVAVRKIGCPESTLVVVTGGAALSLAGGAMEDHGWGRNLVFSGTCPQRVAGTAVDAPVPRVAETTDIIGRGVGGPRITGLMAGIA